MPSQDNSATGRVAWINDVGVPQFSRRNVERRCLKPERRLPRQLEFRRLGRRRKPQVPSSLAHRQQCRTPELEATVPSKPVVEL